MLFKDNLHHNTSFTSKDQPHSNPSKLLIGLRSLIHSVPDRRDGQMFHSSLGIAIVQLITSKNVPGVWMPTHGSLFCVEIPATYILLNLAL